MSRVEHEAERYAVLEDPQRRAIYLLVRRQQQAVTRDDVAQLAGVSRSLAAFHLDRLLDAGLLAAHYARPPGVGGRGAGRPAKRYVATDVELALLIPHRDYALAGRVLARAVDGAGPGDDVRQRVDELAAAEGRGVGELAAEAAPVASGIDGAAALVAELGYEPVAADGVVVLRNCPFHAIVDCARTLVCGLNQSFVAGVLDGAGVDGVRADLVSAEGRCCVVLAPSSG